MNQKTRRSKSRVAAIKLGDLTVRRINELWVVQSRSGVIDEFDSKQEAVMLARAIIHKAKYNTRY